jgi:hypothetical protein
MKSFEVAQTSLKEYNPSIKLDVIDLTGGNDDADTTPSGAKKDSAAVTLSSDYRNRSAERKESIERSGSGEKKASAEKKQSSEANATSIENYNEGV